MPLEWGFAQASPRSGGAHAHADARAHVPRARPCHWLARRALSCSPCALQLSVRLYACILCVCVCVHLRVNFKPRSTDSSHFSHSLWLGYCKSRISRRLTPAVGVDYSPVASPRRTKVLLHLKSLVSHLLCAWQHLP